MIATLYARYSPRPDAETSESIDKQMERLRGNVIANNYQRGGEFYDAGEDAAGKRHGASGERADNRPDLQAALAEVCSNKDQGVLCVTALDRLSRSVADADAILKQIEKSGAALAILDLKLDTTNPHQRMVFHIISAVNECFRRDIAARTKRAMQKHVANGRRMGRADRIPYGKRLADSACPLCGKPAAAGKRHVTSKGPRCAHDCHIKLLVHENEQVTIQAILWRHRCGEGPGKIATALNKAGSRCRGGPWHKTTVASIIRRNTAAANNM